MSPRNCACARRALYKVFIEPISVAHRPRHAIGIRYFTPQRTKKTSETWFPNANAAVDRTPNVGERQPPRDNRYNSVSRQVVADRRQRVNVARNNSRVPALPPREQRTYDLPYDEEIKDRYIALVTLDGEHQPDVPLDTVLRNLDRATEHLVQLLPSNASTGKLATCRIFTKAWLRETQRAKDKATKEAKKKRVANKILEVNWAIADGDLGNKIAQLGSFLKEGRRVEVLLARKKRARVATGEECEKVLKKIREGIKAVPGAKEEKSEGKMGEKMTLVFESKKTKTSEQGKE